MAAERQGNGRAQGDRGHGHAVVERLREEGPQGPGTGEVFAGGCGVALNDSDLEPLAVFDQLLRQGGLEGAQPPLRSPVPDHDACKAVLAGVGQDVLRRARTGQAHDLGTEVFGQPEVVLDAGTRFFVELFVAVALQIDGVPRRLAARGHALGVTDQSQGQGIRADQQHDLQADLGFVLPHGGAQFVALGVDAFGCPAQRHFTQGQEVALLEEVLGGTLVGALGDVDLALGQALQEFVGRNVDQGDFVGGFEDSVGHGLLDPDTGQTRHLVVDAVEVLDVEGGVDVDAVVEQFLDVLPAFRVARARRIGVRIFVHQDQARLSSEG